MDGSGETPIVAATSDYDGMPDSRVVGRHGMFPETTHDEVARVNFLSQLNRHLALNVAPFVKTAWDKRAEPVARANAGRAVKDRHEVRKALLNDPIGALGADFAEVVAAFGAKRRPVFP